MKKPYLNSLDLSSLLSHKKNLSLKRGFNFWQKRELKKWLALLNYIKTWAEISLV
jgi:hypothetical protein